MFTGRLDKVKVILIGLGVAMFGYFMRIYLQPSVVENGDADPIELTEPSWHKPSTEKFGSKESQQVPTPDELADAQIQGGEGISESNFEEIFKEEDHQMTTSAKPIDIQGQKYLGITEISESHIEESYEGKGNKIPTPDELADAKFEQKINVIELPATIPEIEVIPTELQELELLAKSFLNSENYQDQYEEPLSDNPGLTDVQESLYEAPASEHYMPAIPIELQQIESEYKSKGMNNSDGASLVGEVGDILYDNPKTLDLSDPKAMNTEPPSVASRNADFE